MSRKSDQFLLNLGCYEVFEMPLIREYLAAGRLSGVWIDPTTRGVLTENVKKYSSNIIWMPHLGGDTEEAQARLACETLGSLVEWGLVDSR